jgi:hypothetical protein
MTTLFDATESAPAPVENDNTSANGASELEVLRKRLADKDKFIEELKTETAEYRKDLSARMSLEELYAKRTVPASSPAVTQPNGEREVRVDVQNTNNVPSKEEVADLVRQALSQELTKAATQNNIRQTKQELEAAWGSNFVEKLEARIQDLGIGKEFIDDVAGRSPKAVLALLGVGTTTENPNAVNTKLEVPPQSRRPANNLPVDNGPRGKSYYDNLRRTDPKRYLSPSVQIEMHNRAIAMGTKFFES